MRRRVERPNGEAAWAFAEGASMEGANDGQTSAPTRTARLSRLAVASVPAAFLGCPIIVGEFRRWVDQYLPPQFHQTGEYGFVHLWFIVGCMSVASFVPALALLRIVSARGRRSGVLVAAGAFSVSLLWWALLAFT